MFYLHLAGAINHNYVLMVISGIGVLSISLTHPSRERDELGDEIAPDLKSVQHLYVFFFDSVSL